LEKRKFIIEESEIDVIISLKVSMFVWQDQIKGLRNFLKRKKIIINGNISDMKFDDKKFMNAYYNDKQFIELSKLKIEEREKILNSESENLDQLKFEVRRENVICVNKKIYQYLNDLKNTIPRNNRKK
jgi:hypothetical protein